ncbi:MAG: AzlC family ABC transporter permease [Ruminococcaceae bacterium]|nr:AzlC family ABC transporter permease [Oscillospiraceae bacterium]
MTGVNRRQWFLRGMRAGIPICMGYFAVAIALGISARSAGITSLQAALTSLLINASAGEYVGFALIAAGASYVEVALMEAVANARYLLMSASLSQKLDGRTRLWERLLLGFTVTDEIFGASISVEGKLSPYFTYGAFIVATTGWTGGTFVGAMLGDVLPVRLLSALAVGLYGMFISVFVPEAKKNKVVMALVGTSFALSLALEYIPYVRDISEGIRIIVLTVIISLAAAIIFPVKEDNSRGA